VSCSKLTDRPVKLDVPGADAPNVHTLRTVEDGNAIDALLAGATDS